jgi:lipopolysaccharide export system permease protein
VSFRTSPPLLERYVLRESILPFFLGFGLVTFLFILDFLFDFLDLLLAKNVPPLIVLELFLLALGWITALSFPCGVLVAALMTYGRLAQDNEVTAMRSLGVNVARILRGPMGAAVVLAGLLCLFNNYVLPETNHRFANLRLAIHRKSPAAKIEPGIFIKAFDKYDFMVREIDHKTGEMTDITIYDYTESDVPTTILAKRGRMKYMNHSATLKLDLMDGEIHEVPGATQEGRYRRGMFDQHTLYLQNAGAILQRSDRKGRSEREMNIQMMLEEIQKREEQKAKQIAQLEEKVKEAGFSSYVAFERTIVPPSFPEVVFSRLGLKSIPAPDTTVTDPKVLSALMIHRTDLENIERRIDAYEVEIHKKFSIPFACVVFVLVGGPLGIRTRKGGFANMAIAVAFFIVYYFFLIGGEQLADRRFLSPALAMWLPNILFGLVGIYLTVSVVGWGPSRGMR